MNRLKRLSLWDRVLVLDFLVLATIGAVVAVGFAQLLLAARRLHRWLRDRRMDDVQRHVKKP